MKDMQNLNSLSMFQKEFLRRAEVLFSLGEKLSLILAISFLVLTFVDRLTPYRCGFIWTTAGALFCGLSYLFSKRTKSFLIKVITLFFLILGLSAGLTPFAAQWLPR
jgi:hypothetical protein